MGPLPPVSILPRLSTRKLLHLQAICADPVAWLAAGDGSNSPPEVTAAALPFLAACWAVDPAARASLAQLQAHPYLVG